MSGDARTSSLSLSEDSFVVYDADAPDYGPQDTPTQAPSPTFPPHHARELPLLETRRAAYAATPLLGNGGPSFGGHGELDEDLEADGDAVDDGTGQTTLNKGSQGRGGWRMLGSGPGGVSRFEPLTWTEISAMCVHAGHAGLTCCRSVSCLAVVATTGLALAVVLAPSAEP